MLYWRKFIFCLFGLFLIERKSILFFRLYNWEEVFKFDEFVRRLIEGEGFSKFVFQKCGLGFNVIRELVMLYEGKEEEREGFLCNGL